MRFFERQKVDLVGQVSVSLQKCLIFLMIINGLSLTNGGLIGFGICVIGFVGALRRRTCFLMAYFAFSVAMIVMMFVFAMMMILTMNDYEYSEDSFSSESSSSGSFQTYPMPAVRNLLRSAGFGRHGGHGHGHNEASSSSFSSASASTESFASTSYSYFNGDDGSMYLLVALSVLGVVFTFIVAYIKVKSIALAYRLRKMILATSVLPTTEYRQEQQDNSCGVEAQEEQVPEQVPIFVPPHASPFMGQPGYMPFTPIPMPNMQQYPGAPSMVPPPMMYGQYPVYYSFAPIPQSAQPEQAEHEQKL